MRPLLPILALIASLAAGSAVAAEAPRGKAVFDLWCGGCHKPLGPYVSSVAGTSVLERTYKGSKPAALEQRTDLDAATVKLFVRKGSKFMPFFRKTEIGDEDLEALAAYLAKGPRSE